MSSENEKLVPSGTLAKASIPVHEHGLRSTADRSGHLARESTHQVAPT